VCEPGEQQPHGDRGHLSRDESLVDRAATTEQLGGNRRPGGILVGVPALQAVQARSGSRLNEGTDARPAVTEHEGQVRHVAPEPQPVECGIDDEVSDDDGDTERLGGGRDVSANESRRHPACDEHVGHPVDGGPVAGDHDGARPRPRLRCLDEQDRVELAQQAFRLARIRSRRVREHRQPRPADPDGEGGDHSLLRFGHVVEGDRGIVDTELQAVRAAPDETKPRVDVKHHFGILPAHRGARRRVSTGDAPAARLRR